MVVRRKWHRFVALASSLVACADAPSPSGPAPDGEAVTTGGVVASTSAAVSTSGESSSGSEADADSSGTQTTGGAQEPELDVAIAFPPPFSHTVHPSIVVRGTTPAGAGVTSVVVASVPASSDDGFAHWQAEIELAQGLNEIEIVVHRDDGEPVSSQIVVVSEELILAAWDGALSADGSTYYVLGHDLHGVDVESGYRTRLPGSRTMPYEQRISWDPTADRLIHTDRWSGIETIDPQTGEVEVLVELEPEGVVPSVNDHVVDEARGRLLVVRSWRSDVQTVDLATGELGWLVGGNVEADTVIADATAIEVDVAGNRAFVATEQLAYPLVVVDLDTGSAAPFGDDGAILTIRAMEVDADRGRLLMLEPSEHQSIARIWEVDLVTGDRSTWLNAGDVPEVWGANDIALRPETDELLLLDGESVVAVDLDTKASRPISDNHYPTDAWVPDTQSLFAMSYDGDSDRLLAYGLGTTVVEVDRTTGVAVPLGELPWIPFHGQQFFDAERNRVLGLAGEAGVVSEPKVRYLDLATMTGGVLSDDTTPDATLPFEGPIAMARDLPRNRAIVVDAGGGRLVAVDLDSGARSLLVELAEPVGIDQLEIDSDAATAYGMTSVPATVVRCDLADGSVTSIATLVGAGRALALDEDRGRLYAGVDTGDLYEIDLATGDASVIASVPIAQQTNVWEAIIDFDLDPRSGTLFVADARGIVAFDPLTRQSVSLSK